MRNFVRPAEATRVPISLQTLIDDILQLCTFELQRSQVRMTLELDENSDDVVSADAIQIQQVLVNLVQNAQQAMHATPADGRVLTVRLACLDEELQIDVEDTGPGFDRTAADSVNSPFVTTKPEGLGMGLAISRTIVAAHGGRLWACNKEQGGARVSFTLPALRTHTERVAATADRVCRG
jgi:C4-dicarboxylate-specific signal transduction histidine kinase